MTVTVDEKLRGPAELWEFGADVAVTALLLAFATVVDKPRGPDRLVAFGEATELRGADVEAGSDEVATGAEDTDAAEVLMGATLWLLVILGTVKMLAGELHECDCHHPGGAEGVCHLVKVPLVVTVFVPTAEHTSCVYTAYATCTCPSLISYAVCAGCQGPLGWENVVHGNSGRGEPDGTSRVARGTLGLSAAGGLSNGWADVEEACKSAISDSMCGARRRQRGLSMP